MRAGTARAARLAAAAAALGTPWVILFVRLWLAASFLALHVKMMIAGQTLAAPLHAGAWARLFAAAAATGPGGIMAMLFPVLLALGLGARPAALAMLLQVALLHAPGETLALKTCAAMLLAGIAVLGPGRLSLDGLLAPGLRNAALPGRRLVPEAYRAITAAGRPIFLLLLRLVMALLVVAPHTPPASAMRLLAATRLPSAPGMLDALPDLVAAALATLLAAGLGVRPVALFLLLLVPLPMAPFHAADLPIHVALLLALLVCCGGGAVSVDRALLLWLSRRSEATNQAALPHVVIVGGGFGGLATAMGLTGAPCRITLIDHRNYHLFQPLLYQVATAGLSPADIATPIRAMFRGRSRLHVRLGEVSGVDLAGRAVLLGDERIEYDTLVLATGARHSYFGHDEWSALAPGLKSIEDATAIRSRLLRAFEAAEAEPDPAARRAWLTFVVIGGGPTGVELAGAIAELARFGMAGEFREIDPASARVLLVQAGDRVLPSFPPALSRRAASSLERLGVELSLGAAAEAIEADGVRMGGHFVPARTVLWAAGVMASPAAAWLGAAADRAGRAVVGPDLTIPGHENVFVIGDTAASRAWGGRDVPGLAPAAKQGGAYAARAIRARMAGRKVAPFRYHHYGSLATIGRKAAVAEFGPLRVSGAIAWWLWGTAHIFFLVGGRNRVAVILDWLWDYLTFRRSIRLITGRTAEM